jgi:hypothetical protein
MKTEVKEVRTEIFGLRLTPTELKQLGELAELEDRSLGDMMRMCFIREYRVRVQHSHKI